MGHRAVPVRTVSLVPGADSGAQAEGAADVIQELLYTSAPKGLKAGSRGFCTVLSTQGMSAPLAAALEGLSGYRPLFAPTDPRHASNPVVHSHLTFSVG